MTTARLGKILEKEKSEDKDAKKTQSPKKEEYSDSDSDFDPDENTETQIETPLDDFDGYNYGAPGPSLDPDEMRKRIR